MKLAALLLVALVGSPVAGPQEEPDDAALLQAWESLARSKSRKEKVAKAFLAKVEALDSEQLQLVRELCQDAKKPKKPGKPPYFDPSEHLRNQPVRRKAVDPEDERYLAVQRRLLGDPSGRALRCAYRYDWYERAVVKTGEPDDPELVFHNALCGYPPGLDLARAQALARLDRGDEEATLRAFANSYTDRAGGLYPGITLYDAWLSGQTVEMPDVDALGIVHTLLDDWKTWPDPVPDDRHDALYAKLGELFARARDWREPRESLADTLLVADPVPRRGYESLHGNFHALWAKHGSDVGALAAEFPGVDGWRPWVEAWVETCKTVPGVWEEGQARAKRLEESAALVRAALAQAMREQGVLDD